LSDAESRSLSTPIAMVTSMVGNKRKQATPEGIGVNLRALYEPIINKCKQIKLNPTF
jgi:hypothetical protein